MVDPKLRVATAAQILSGSINFEDHVVDNARFRWALRIADDLIDFVFEDHLKPQNPFVPPVSTAPKQVETKTKKK